MFVWTLVNDIKGENGGRRFPPGAEVDVESGRLLFLREHLHVITIFVDIVRGLVREDCLDGDTFTQAFPYPFHLQSASCGFGSYLEGGFGGFGERGRKGAPVRYREGV